IAAQRSVLQLGGARLEKRVAHWSRIAQAASEQCGRNRLMAVDAPGGLREWLEQPAEGLRLPCHPEAGPGPGEARDARPGARALREWLEQPAEGLRLLCHPEAGPGLAEALHAQPGLRTLSLLVGPEGGWSDAELALAAGHGVQAVRYGQRVLRTETAGLALIA